MLFDLTPHPGSQWTADAVTAVLAARHHSASPLLGDIAPPVPPASWGDVVDAIRRHRVAALLAPHWETLGMPAEIQTRLRAMSERHLRTGLSLQNDTAVVSSLLCAASIRHLVVKGVALAALVGDDAASRGAGDVDVWVQPEDVPRAAVELSALGYVADAKMRHALSSADWRHGALLYWFPEISLRHERMATVDLHWRLTPAPHELSFEFDDAYGRSSTISLGDVAIPTLCPADALEHIANHGRKEGWPVLRQLVDVERLVARSGAAVAQGLAKHDRDADLALQVSSHVAPWLTEWTGSTLRSERLARHAWRRCMSLQTGGQARPRVEGRARFEVMQRERVWALRSGVRWQSQLFSLGQLIALPYALLEPGNAVVSYARYVVRKARSLLMP